MDSKNGGPNSNSSTDASRHAAAEIARKKVLAAYEKPQKSTNDHSHLENAPINQKISSKSWEQYHSAWQNYYQKYYSTYYSKAAQNYIEKERLKDARNQAEEEEILSSLSRAIKPSAKKSGLKLNTAPDTEQINTDLRQKIQKRATDSAKKTRKFRKFIPFVLGLAVILIILFLQYNRLIFAPIMAYVSPGDAPASEIEAIDPTITTTVSSEPRLIIPKINVDVPIRFNVAVNDVMSAMNNGVAHYRIAGASAYPGEIGNFVITGHSAGDVYSSNPYKYIFSGLERLEAGDLIYVNYESVRYTYQVTEKEVVEPTNVASLVKNTNKPLITLVTCTPLGTSRYRLLVTGEQISPAINSASTEEQATITTETADMPSNEPEFFESIWNWLTGN